MQFLHKNDHQAEALWEESRAGEDVMFGKEEELRPWEYEIPREKVESILENGDDDTKEMISPPVISEPVVACALAINLTSVIPGLLVQVQADGAPVTAVQAEPTGENGLGILLPRMLHQGEELSVRQGNNSGLWSPWSPGIIVRSATDTYKPQPPPRPSIFGAELFKCGVRTCVKGVPVGAIVVLLVGDTTIAKTVCMSSEICCLGHRALNVGEVVRARWWLCTEDDGAVSNPVKVVDEPPLPLSTPVVEPVYAGQSIVVVSGLTRGALFQLTQGSDQIVFATGHSRAERRLPHAAVAGESIAATQWLCQRSDASPDEPVETQACLELPPPRVAPPSAGDRVIRLQEHLFEARKEVYVLLPTVRLIGNSGGSVVELSEAVQPNNPLLVRQVLGDNCFSPGVLLRSSALAPEPIPPLCGTMYYPTGRKEYKFDPMPNLKVDRILRGVYWYPIDPAVPGNPKDDVPCVVFQHGNHQIMENGKEVLNFQGYEYLQRALAQIGIASVSVDVNFKDLVESSPTRSNITARADLANAHRRLVQTNPDNFFGNHYRFGLFGHSRGGDAVVLLEARERRGDPTLSLAPTDFTKYFGGRRPVIDKASLLVILAAADGDVSGLPGARFYDTSTAMPLPFPREQLYVAWTNHNWFNTEWWQNDSDFSESELLPAAMHRAILCEYTMAFFASAFRIQVRPGLNTARVLTGQAVPRHLPAQHLQICFDMNFRLVVDDFEQPNGVGRSTLGELTLSSGLGTAERLMRALPYVGYSKGLELQRSRLGNTGRGTFHWALDRPRNLRNLDVRVRLAERSDAASASSNTPIRLDFGVTDSAGRSAWLDMASATPYGIRRPFVRPDITKTVFETFSLPTAWFQTDEEIDLSSIVQISIRTHNEANGSRSLAVDDVQIRIPLFFWSPTRLLPIVQPPIIAPTPSLPLPSPPLPRPPLHWPRLPLPRPPLQSPGPPM